MNSAMGNMTITLFGLEEDIWEATEDSEKSTYRLVTSCFIIFFLLAAISSVFLVYLIIDSLIYAIPFGLLAALIIGSVVRFSLIIMRRSIFDDNINSKESNTLIKTFKVENQKKAEKSHLVKQLFKKPLLIFFLKIKSIKFKWPKSNRKVPGLAANIRILIISMMGLLVLFPLATLFHFSDLEEINQRKREEYLSQFEKNTEYSLKNRTTLIEREIKLIEDDLEKNKSIYLKDGLLKEKNLTLTKLKSDLNKEVMNFEEERAAQINHFTDDISGKYFLTLTFTAVIRKPFFFIFTFIIIALLLIPHLMLFRLQMKEGDTYSKRSTEHYKKIIDDEYLRTSKEGYDYLFRKWGYKPQGYGVGQGVFWAQNQFWSNPPYNTIPHQPFSEKKKIEKETFLKRFEIQSTIEVNK